MENQENINVETAETQAVEERNLSFFEKLIAFFKKDKKRTVIIGVIALVLIIAIVVVAVLAGDSSKEDTTDSNYDYNANYYTPTYSYDLMTVDELVNTFEETFSVSELKQEESKTMFKVSTGETIMGFTDESGEVVTFNVHTTGTSFEAMLRTSHHFYPMCHFLTEITGETVSIDALIDIYASVDPVVEEGSVSTYTTWTVVKEGIEYEMVITEMSSYNYMSMDLYARIK